MRKTKAHTPITPKTAIEITVSKMMNAHTTKGDATAHSPIAIESKIMAMEITAGNIRMANIPIIHIAGIMMKQAIRQITIDNPRARTGSIRHPIEIPMLIMAHPIISDAVIPHSTSKSKHIAVRKAQTAHPTQHNPAVINRIQVKVRQMQATMQAAHKIIDPTPQNITVGIQHANAIATQIIETHIEAEQHIRDSMAISTAHIDPTMANNEHATIVNPQMRHVIQAITHIIHGKIQHNVSNPPHIITRMHAIIEIIQHAQHGIPQIKARNNANELMKHTIANITEHIDPNMAQIDPTTHEIMQIIEHITAIAPHIQERTQHNAQLIQRVKAIAQKIIAQIKSNAHHAQNISAVIMHKHAGRRHTNDGMTQRHPSIVIMQHIGQYKMAQIYMHAIIRQRISITTNNIEVSIQKLDEIARA